MSEHTAFEYGKRYKLSQLPLGCAVCPARTLACLLLASKDARSYDLPEDLGVLDDDVVLIGPTGDLHLMNRHAMCKLMHAEVLTACQMSIAAQLE